MIKNFFIIKNITAFILPYIFLYGLYIQTNSNNFPGGGFQSGVIFASILVTLKLIDKTQNISWYNINTFLNVATIGILLYTILGIVSILYHGNYLTYNFFSDNILSQNVGIIIVEIAVGISVSSTLTLIYLIIDKE